MRAVDRVQWLWAHSIGGALQWTLLGLIWVYQKTISPLLPPSCRYYPSCSAYAMGSIRAHGALKGAVACGLAVTAVQPVEPRWRGSGTVTWALAP
jgi:putative membrane protein insertion efficiency factor